MITKERLLELIKQEATIYEVKYKNINPVFLRNQLRDVNYKYGFIVFEPNPYEKYKHHKYIKNLFETREEAEWHKEFGNITRIENLVLPTWEQITEEDFEEVFAGNDGELYTLKVDKELDDITIYSNSGMGYYIRIDEATKENYTLACRRCKELFLGGE